MPNRKLLSRKYLIIGGVILVVLLLLYNYISSPKSQSAQNSSKVNIKAALASTEINKEFTFPLRDSKNKEVSKLIFTLEKAEIRDEIIVKGKKSSAVEGRTFLVVNLKVKNEFNKAVQISTRDYIRLSVNGNENEWLAPDIHNDPVEVQAISTKLTRVAFPINNSDRNFVLQIGEIEGDKEKIQLELKQ